MGDPSRPALPEVLAALTDTDADLWGACRSVAADGAVVGTLGNTNVPCIVRWTTTDPADAAETLVARGLLPEGWCGGERWWCAACQGVGRKLGATWPCGICEGSGACDVPAGGIPELVALVSLGVPAVQRAEVVASFASKMTTTTARSLKITSASGRAAVCRSRRRWDGERPDGWPAGVARGCDRSSASAT